MSVPSHQLALKTLILGIDAAPELLADAKRIAFLRGVPHEGLLRFQSIMECEQVFKPRATMLEEAGFKTVNELKGPYDAVLFLPERQREQTLADFVYALDLLREGGTLITSLHNDWGAKRYEGHLKELVPKVEHITKYHSRVFWATKPKRLPEKLMSEWREIAALRREIDGQFWSKPGLFAWDHIDGGSKMLVDLLPANIKGNVADLGSGWGYLSQHVLNHCPGIVTLDAYEADRNGMEATRRNIGNVKASARARALWHDVTAGIEPRHYDFIVMNPPFHEGREPEPELGMKFVAAAARALRTTGQLWMVANRHLPYEELLHEVFDQVTIVKQDDGYKVINCSMPRHDLFFHRGQKRHRR